jgi:hypothetical protein
MRLRPALEPEWLDRDPVHVSLLGGTNTGKSTLLNVLLGRAAAGMDVTARYSQHPEGYRIRSLGNAWLEGFPSRFAGYRRFEDEHPPRQSDEELESEGYRAAIALLDPARIGRRSPGEPATTTAVLWDVPDFSTEEARHWLGAVLDTIALAEVILFVVTDESYADDRACSLLGLLSDAGADLHVIANKVPSGGTLSSDIRRKIDSHWRGPGGGLPADRYHRLEFVEGGGPADRLERLLATREAGALRGTIADEVSRGIPLKESVLVRSVHFVERHLDEVVEPIREEIRLGARWREAVRTATDREFLARYRSDYLDGARYGEFNRTLVRLMERLEVPGVGELVKMLGQIVRIPVAMLTGMVRRVLGKARKAPKHTPEHEILAERFAAWLATLRSEAQGLAAAGDHPMWREIAAELDSEDRIAALTERLEQAYAEYRPAIEAETRRRAAEIHESIEKRPILLNALRSANLAVDTAAVILVVKSGGLNWSDAIVGPAVAGMRRVLLESGLEQYLASQENRLKRSQYELMEGIVRSRLEEPVARLFASEFAGDDARAVREDFARVRDAILARHSEEAR